MHTGWQTGKASWKDYPTWLLKLEPVHIICTRETMSRCLLLSASSSSCPLWPMQQSHSKLVLMSHKNLLHMMNEVQESARWSLFGSEILHQSQQYTTNSGMEVHRPLMQKVYCHISVFCSNAMTHFQGPYWSWWAKHWQQGCQQVQLKWVHSQVSQKVY